MSADLITRLEQAEAGSRELDAEIYQALRYHQGLKLGLAREHIAVWRHVGGGIVDSQGSRDVVPPWTTSLDAIVALIGEKLPGWNVTIRIPSDPKHRHVCEIGAPDNPEASITDPWPFRASAGGSNAPLACAAALLRAIKEGEHG